MLIPKILLYFLELEKRDNYKHLLLVFISRALNETTEFTMNYNSNLYRFLTIFIGIPYSYLNNQYLKSYELEFIEKYLLSDFCIFQEKLSKKIKNKYLIKEYEFLYKNITETFILCWQSYNELLNKLFAYILLNIYVILIFLINLKELNNFKKQNLNPYFQNYKDINIYINDIFENISLVHEMDTFNLHKNEILKKMTNLFKDNYSLNLNISSLLNTYLLNIKRDTIISNTIFVNLTTYNPIIEFKLSKDIHTDLSKLIKQFTEFHAISIKLNDYFEILEETITIHPIKNYFKELSFSFNETPIFKNTSVTIPSQKWIYFYGTSGQGKTTFINILLKYYHYDQGKIRYMGLYDKYKYDDIKKDISYISLNSDLFFFNSLLFNLTYGLKVINDELMDLIHYYLNIFDLKPFINKLEENIQALSGGQKQRVKIIRLLLHDKPIWFMDEATSNLNTSLEINCLKILKKIQEDKKKSVIFICHNLEIISYCDLVMKINDYKLELEDKETFIKNTVQNIH